MEPLEPLDHMKSVWDPADGPIRFTSMFSEWMPEKILEVMSGGGSLVQAAVACRISRSTLFNWKDPKHATYEPRIAEACLAGMALSQAWWERQGQQGVWGGKMGFVPQAFSFQMKNRFRHDYSETPQAAPEIPETNPLIDALKESAATDWKDEPDEPSLDIDDHGN